MKYNWNFDGYAYNADGSPRANATVEILIPYTLGYYYYNTTTTDATGKFTFKCDPAKDVYNNYNHLSATNGDCSGIETQYCWSSKDSNGQFFIYPTNMMIACQGSIYEEDVSVYCGSVITTIILGNAYVWRSNLPSDAVLRWHII